MVEKLEIYNSYGEKIGEKIYSELEKSDWIKVSTLFIVNSKNNILFQIRAKNNKHLPGFVDLSAGGKVSLGENPIETIIRETKEELNLNIHEENLILLKKFPVGVLNGRNFNRFNYIYLIRMEFNKEEIQFNRKEIDSLFECNFEDLKSANFRIKHKFIVPDSFFWDEIIIELKKNLNSNIK